MTIVTAINVNPTDVRQTEAPRALDAGFPASELEDAVAVAREGREIDSTGVPYVVPGLVPNIGSVGFNVAFSKVGKTTFGQSLAAAVATGRPFIGKLTTRTRVLMLAVEDPPEYTAWLARHLDVEPGWMTFRRRPLVLNPKALKRICATVKDGRYGLVLIASWQAAVRGLIRDENDNAGAVRVVEDVKAAARATGVPWLIDAHSGKGEDQHDDADPSMAMRGASAAAGAADYTLSLRYANGAFGTHRRLSGKGRFVAFEPVLIDYDPTTGTYAALGTTKSAATATTFQLIVDTGALTTDWQPEPVIAATIGCIGKTGKVTTSGRRKVRDALMGRPGIDVKTETGKGGSVRSYKLAAAQDEVDGR